MISGSATSRYKLTTVELAFQGMEMVSDDKEDARNQLPPGELRGIVTLVTVTVKPVASVLLSRAGGGKGGLGG